MGWNTPDVYYQPEKFGLKIIADVEWDHEDYQFNMTVVWQDEDGNFYMADDSGCSCPSPFENVTALDMLDGPFTAFEVVSQLTESANQILANDYSSYSWKNVDEYKNTVSMDVTHAIEQVMANR